MPILAPEWDSVALKVHEALHLSTHGRPVWPMAVRHHHRSKTIARHPVVVKREVFLVHATEVYLV